MRRGYRLLSRCAITVTSLGFVELGRCSFTVLLPFSKYPPCFGPAPWLPPVPVIPCWWCWWPGTKFSFRSRFSTFLLTKADIGRSGGRGADVQKDLFDVLEIKRSEDLLIIVQETNPMTSDFDVMQQETWFCATPLNLISSCWSW